MPWMTLVGVTEQLVVQGALLTTLSALSVTHTEGQQKEGEEGMDDTLGPDLRGGEDSSRLQHIWYHHHPI